MPIVMRLGVTIVAGVHGVGGAVGSQRRRCRFRFVRCFHRVATGLTYSGRGGVKRDPEVTGRSMPAVLPGCDDSGGQSEAEPDVSVRVDELADVASSTAVLWHGSIFIRDERDLPQETQRWFRAPRCGTAGTFEATGRLARGDRGRRTPRFDGDIRPPYRLEVHVTSGPTRICRERRSWCAPPRLTDPATDPGGRATLRRREGRSVPGSMRGPTLCGPRSARELTQPERSCGAPPKRDDVAHGTRSPGSRGKRHDRRSRPPMAVHQRTRTQDPDGRAGVVVRGGCSSSPRCPASTTSCGSPGSGKPTSSDPARRWLGASRVDR